MAQIQKGTTYSTGDQVTAANLNALADAAILLPGAITDQTAKTVPLAADTILLHSAADTALRKSTLTQLFSNATGIPLTTGVTGVLPSANGGTGVNNGANTLTIAGNVTHAGAFTQTFTATANTSLTLPTTGTLATLAGSEALSNKTITASPISGSTGAFTTLSASGTATVGPNNAGTGLALLQLFGGSGTNGGASVRFGTNGTSYSEIGQASGILGGTSTDLLFYANNGSQNIKFYAGGAGGVATISSTGLAVTGALSATGNITSTATNTYFAGSSSTAGNIYYGSTGAASPVQTLVNNTPITTVSSSGLAVTGGLSTTGSVIATAGFIIGNDNSFLYDSGTAAVTLRLGASGPYGSFLTNSGDFMVDGAGGTLALGAGGSRVATISSTGLAVTGNLSASSALNDFYMTSTTGTNRCNLRFINTGGIYLFGAEDSVGGGFGATAYDGAISIPSGRGFAVVINGTGVVQRTTSTGLAVTGALSCTGALSKGSGSFRIEHPLPEKSATHELVHSFIEGPQADLIYRGKVVLVDGKASVNIDAAATMTEGTFEVLCREVQCFTTNENGWTAVRGKVTGNILTIEAKDADCSDEISWMVIGERQDPHMIETDWTDDNGKVIVEPLKPSVESN
jgi:hypothetical protein